MDPTVVYAKTAKGSEEIQSRSFKLPPRTRMLLIMVDGRSTAGELIEKGKAGGNSTAFETLAQLESGGFIAPAGKAGPAGPRPAQPAPAQGASTPDMTRERSLPSVRRFAIEQMITLLGPNGDEFTARIESAADRTTLFAELERCRNALRAIAGSQKSDRFWAGVLERLP